MTWLLSSFFPRELVRALYFSSSPGGTTTVRSSGGSPPGGLRSLTGCPVENRWRWRCWERFFSFRARRMREQMQLGHGGGVITPVCAAEESSCLPVYGKKKKTPGPPRPLVSRRSVVVAATSDLSRHSLSLSLHTCRPGLCVGRRHNEDFRNGEKCKRML